MVYFLLAEGFEEIECLTPVDLLRRGGIAVTLVSVNDALSVTGSHGITVNCGISAEALLTSGNAPRDMEMLVLPGGMPGTRYLDASPFTNRLLHIAEERQAYICAICAAPMVLGKRGLLRGKNATCFPGFEQYLEGAVVKNEKAVRDGKIITGKGMGASFPFGLALLEALTDRETAITMAHNICL